MPLALITSVATAEAVAEAEDTVRAGIVNDYWRAIDRGDHAAALVAAHLAKQIDASTPHGPRLLDELADAHQPAAA